jgi:transposase
MVWNIGMPTSFRPYSPDQDLLLPQSLKEWLPEDHLSYFISDVVDELDLSAFYSRYEGDGRRKSPFDPSMMLKVLIYAYATGTFSSRKIARKLEEDIAYRVLGADNFPQHRTLCDFRLQHLDDFKSLFVQVVQIAQAAGLVQLGTLAIDGTKVQANASKRKAMSYQRLKEEETRLAKDIDALCYRAGEVDATEDAQLGLARRGDEVPDELAHRQQRLEQIRAAKKRLEVAQATADRERGRSPDDDRKPRGGGRGSRYKRDFGVPADKDQSNFTDPQSCIMPTSHGWQQCYNGQLAVDEDFQIIVANRLTANPSDKGELVRVLDEVQATLGRFPKEVLADAGYRKEADFATLETRQIDGYVALGKEGKSDQIHDPDNNPATVRMAEKLQAPYGKERYRDRKYLVEAPNGWIKHVIGFRQFSVRGLEAVKGEWNLITMATNLRRMRPLLKCG